MRFPRFYRALVLGLLLVLAGTHSTAQVAPQSFPEVAEVAVEFEGVKTVSEQFVRSNVQIRKGMEYNVTLVDQSIRTLYGTELFEFVEVELENVGEDAVNVIFRLVPKYQIDQILFVGNEAYSNGRLAKQFEVEPGDFLDEYDVSVAADQIRAFYVKKGYSDAEVNFQIIRDAETGAATVSFRIDEALRIKIKKITFEGNELFKDGRLRRVMKTKKRNWLSWITGTGRLDEAKFAEDMELLRDFYRNEGYLDVEIDEDAVVIDERRPGRLYINIPVVEGERYFVGEVGLDGHTIFTESELMNSFRLDTDDVFSPDRVQDAASDLTDYYTSRGYLDTRVIAERAPNLETRRIDVVFRIAESERFFLESIIVEGNTKTKSTVIIRELALRPGDVFDLVRMRTSEQRLRNTRFFEDVSLTPTQTNIPGRRDLSIRLREARTGNLSFGAGFSTVESVIVFAELTQGNFDLFNWRSGFQGAGQKFRVRVSLGSSSNQALISFEEPWLFQQRLAFGVELFRTETGFNSSDYNELRTGFELYLRRRLFELVEGRLSYRLEVVDIMDVNPFGPQVFIDGAGETIVSKVGFNLLRDTRDDLIFTRTGNRTLLISEMAGGAVSGDADYVKLEARTAQFIPTFEVLEQTLSLIARAGSIMPYGSSDDVPFFDRYYLGGPDDLRGFEFRDVGPRDSAVPSEPVGGNAYGFFSAEYSFRLAEPLALVAFYDWGFLNSTEFDFDPSNYNDNWGVGARIFVLGSPLKLDLGVPITADDVNDKGIQFNFSFGTRF